jgi:uncharacterized protein YbcV (DUF1398 family)
MDVRLVCHDMHLFRQVWSQDPRGIHTNRQIRKEVTASQCEKRKNMNTTLIVEAARKTLAGKISFPEVVGQLLTAGVEYYYVDYVGLKKTFYSAEGDMVETPINYEELPPVAAEFDTPSLRANILDSQRNNQPYRNFTRRAMEAGVQGYFAFLRGKRVTYFGRQGDQHTEWFPGAAPAK